MISALTTQSMTSINMALCDQFGQKFEVKRPHNISLILRQMDQLDNTSEQHKVAHAAYMINKLKPFGACNLKTGALLAVRGREASTLMSVAGMLKHGADVKAIADALREA